MVTLLTGILEQGLIYAFLALGVYISFQVLNFADLTVDGSFALGGAVVAMMLSKQLSPMLAILVAFIFGMLAGSLTGTLHVYFGITDFLAGTIVQIGLYTINLWLAGGSYVTFYEAKTIFHNDFIDSLFANLSFSTRAIIVSALLLFVVKAILDFFFSTKAGLLLRATGENAILVNSLAVDPGKEKIKGLALANGLAALSGAVLVQQQAYFDISMGTGVMVMGLASIIIGLRVFKKLTWMQASTMAMFGSILYKAILALAIRLGLPAEALKLAIAVILFVVLLSPKRAKKRGKYVKN